MTHVLPDSHNDMCMRARAPPRPSALGSCVKHRKHAKSARELAVPLRGVGTILSLEKGCVVKDRRVTDDKQLSAFPAPPPLTARCSAPTLGLGWRTPPRKRFCGGLRDTALTTELCMVWENTAKEAATLWYEKNGTHD